jgi:hypothetical protein
LIFSTDLLLISCQSFAGRESGLKKSGVVLMLSLLLFCGCSDDNTEKKIVGKWQEVGNPMGRLVFSKDHTGQAYWPSDKGMQESSAMTWKIMKGENKVSVITPPGPVDFEIKPDKLVAPNGVVLTKVK